MLHVMFKIAHDDPAGNLATKKINRQPKRLQIQATGTWSPEIYIQSAPNNSNETHTLCVWAERAVLGSAKTALKFKYKIEIG